MILRENEKAGKAGKERQSEAHQGRRKDKKKKREKREISQLSAATEIVIVDQHGVQLREGNEFYLSGKIDQEPHHYSLRSEQKTSTGERVVRSLKYHFVTAC